MVLRILGINGVTVIVTGMTVSVRCRNETACPSRLPPQFRRSVPSIVAGNRWCPPTAPSLPTSDANIRLFSFFDIGTKRIADRFGGRHRAIAWAWHGLETVGFVADGMRDMRQSATASKRPRAHVRLGFACCL